MYRIIDKRGTGKTSRLLLLAKENNGIVVCKRPEEMVEKAYAYGLTGIEYVAYGLFSPNEWISTEKPFFIDDLDAYLKYWNKNIKGYTISED